MRAHEFRHAVSPEGLLNQGTSVVSMICASPLVWRARLTTRFFRVKEPTGVVVSGTLPRLVRTVPPKRHVVSRLAVAVNDARVWVAEAETNQVFWRMLSPRPRRAEPPKGTGSTVLVPAAQSPGPLSRM